MSNTYLCSMIARLVTMLAILAITVVTAVSSAHAARMSMSSSADHTTHVGEMMHSPEITDPACDPARHCGAADAGMCDFICAGFASFLAMPGAQAGLPAQRSASHGFPAEAGHVGHAPGLNDRPPKLRLL
ncbi:hypothetical protein [Propylenella binzhouense]|nr:hypothetical protein [Propylenella binzhouense]